MVVEFSPAEGHTLLAVEDTKIKTRRGVVKSIPYLAIYSRRKSGLLT